MNRASISLVVAAVVVVVGIATYALMLTKFTPLTSTTDTTSTTTNTTTHTTTNTTTHTTTITYTTTTASSPVYDEQLGILFTQNFTALAYTVTAVEQSDNGYGPAYLLNGLTDRGYWYQVGLAYNWNPDTGFNFVYEVFAPTYVSIFPTSGGAGLKPFSGPVNKGDIVLLSLSFSNDQVIMAAKDENTGATASESYSAEGAMSFVGAPRGRGKLRGFFTGLMTEWYHFTPYYGDVLPVIYSVQDDPILSAWMFISEFNAQDNSILFSDTTPKAITYTNPIELHYLSSNGATVASNAYQFITGST